MKKKITRLINIAIFSLILALFTSCNSVKKNYSKEKQETKIENSESANFHLKRDENLKLTNIISDKYFESFGQNLSKIDKSENTTKSGSNSEASENSTKQNLEETFYENGNIKSRKTSSETESKLAKKNDYLESVITSLKEDNSRQNRVIDNHKLSISELLKIDKSQIDSIASKDSKIFKLELDIEKEKKSYRTAAVIFIVIFVLLIIVGYFSLAYKY